MKPIDVRIDDRGHIWLLQPLTVRGSQWLQVRRLRSANPDRWCWLAGTWCIERRYARNIVPAMQSARLKVVRS